MNAIFDEAKQLINNDGNLWLWNREKMDYVRKFATYENAQKYVELINEYYISRQLPRNQFDLGTEEEYIAAVRKSEAEKKAHEVQAYCQYVDALIQRDQFELKALDGLKKVCQQFDGKVLNKRFHDAVKEETGFSGAFVRFNYELTYYGREYSDKRVLPNIYILAEYGSHCDDGHWCWTTGDRLEAGKAIAIIDRQKSTRLQHIQDLKKSTKKYASYLRLARKAEALMQEMEKYDYVIRDYAKENDLSKYCHAAYIWKR